MKFLISGFEPFLDLKTNPTQLLVNDLSKVRSQNLKNNNFDTEHKAHLSEDFEFKAIVLPVEFKNAFVVLKQAIDTYKPDVVLSLGVASERSDIELERIAINHQSLKNPDNTGEKPLSTKVIESGPDGVFTNLKVDEIAEYLNKHFMNINSDQKVKVSNSAGTYVCNALMYNLILDAKKNDYLAGFIHVPNKTDEVSIQNLKSFIFELIKYFNSKSHQGTMILKWHHRYCCRLKNFLKRVCCNF